MEFNDKKFIKFLKKQRCSLSVKDDKTDLLEKLKKMEYEITPEIIEFLEIFDGKTINFKRGCIDKVSFNCKENLLDKEVADRYAYTVEEQLLPVGFNNNSFCLLFMISKSGKIYGGFDGLFYLIGNNYKEAFINILNDEKILKIELKAEPCTFTNNIYYINENDIEEYKNKFPNSYIFEVDGLKCMTWEKYNEVIKSYLPLKKGYIYTIADYDKLDYTFEEHIIYMRQIDVEYLNKESYLIIITNYESFLLKDLKFKEIFEEEYKNKILSWYDDLIEKQTWSGSYKPFNILIVNNK